MWFYWYQGTVIDTNTTKLLECSKTVKQLKVKGEDEHINSVYGRRLKRPDISVYHTFN